MKKNFPLLLFFLSSSPLFSQYDQWTWMKGNNTTNQLPVYGTQGVAAATNKPGSLYESGEWTDAQGNFWLFAGSDNTGFRNDVWKYDPITNMWTWMKGSGLVNQAGIYGTKGVAAAANNPGGRIVPATWVDNNGKFWLFGGSGRDMAGTMGSLNDLWKYDPITNMWTWMGGGNLINQVGVYGTKGTASATNIPGARYETSCTWTDNSGNMWLFGGNGTNSGTAFNDLWKYDPISDTWTWVSGTNLTNQPSVYGTMGTANVNNIPSGRSIYASWKDLNGDLWLFGGAMSSGTQAQNDMWKYDIVNNTWTWMYGSNLTNQPSVYGTRCVTAASNMHGGRAENRTRWTDQCGNFWIFGGFVTYNDLWRYNPVTSRWTWVSGANAANQLGNYGTQGVSAATNVPGSRGGAIGWKDLNNNFWLFGGFDNTISNRFNDLWRYVPDKPAASFTFNPNNACAPANVSFTNTSTAGCNEIKSYAWNFGDPSSGANNVSTLINPNHVFNTAGTYTVKLVVTNCTGSKDSTTASVTVINCIALTAQIQGACTKMCLGNCQTVQVVANGGTTPYTYNWTPNIGNGPGVYTVCPTTSTVYTCMVYDANGDSASAGACLVTIHPKYNSASAFANASGCGTNSGSATASATGGTGSYTYSWNTGQTSQTATGLSTGTYTVTISDANGCSTSSTVSVVSQPGPTASIASSTNILCNGAATGSATSSSAGGTSPYTYAWSNGQTTAGATGLSAGTYTVTVTDSNGCTSTKSVTVTQPNSIAAATGSSTTNCGGSTGSTSVTASGGTGAYTYSWNNATTTATATGLSAGTYTITITDNNGCTKTATATVGSSGGGTASITSSTNILCNGGTTGNATSSIAGGTSPYTYSWNNGQTTATATGLSAGMYTITITDTNGCVGITTVNITQPVAVAAAIGSSNASCNGIDGTVSVTATGGTGAYTYSWSSGQTTATATGLSAGSYTVLVTDNNGCTKTAATAVGSNGGPTATATATATIIQQGQSTTLNGSGGGTYTWSPSTGLSCTNCQNPTASPTITTQYCVTVSDVNGCTATACVTIFVETNCPGNEELAVPSAFSPNGDGHNDLFVLNGWKDCVSSFVLIIYNRWGERVFESEDPTKAWDGSYKGSTQNAAVFDYYISATNKNGEPFVKKGNITLLR